MRFICNFCHSFMKDIEVSMLGTKIECPNCGKQQVLPATPFGAGRIIDDFVIETKVGEGSIGIVYLAKQITLDRMVALKILSKEYTNEKGIASFLSEARSAARLNHPNIVQVFAVGEDRGICFMAMNFIQGKSICSRIEAEGKIPVDEALHIIQQVAEALYFAWSEEKLIHRDVKPENIMISNDGIVKLTDLGLAIHQKDCTKGMEISGTPYYMSPEQFAGEKLDSRTDIYSLGITLYQMLTGKLPYEGKTLNTVAKQHFFNTPEPISRLEPTILPEVEAFVNKMIAKHPDDRYQNMDELLHALWGIRQKTAPHTEMIPDVHTISIKRLDYKMKEIPRTRPRSAAAAAKDKPHHHTHRPPKTDTSREAAEAADSSFRLNKVFAGILAVVVIFGSCIFIIVNASKQKAIKALGGELSDIEAKIQKTTSYSRNTEEELIRFKTKAAAIQNDAGAILVLRCQLLLSSLEVMKLNAENQRLSESLTATEMKLAKKIQEITAESKQSIANATLQKDSEYSEKIRKLEDDLAAMKNDNAHLAKKLAEAQEAHGTIAKSFEDFRRDTVYSRLYLMIRQFKFAEASSLLNEYSSDSKDVQARVAPLIQRLERLDKEYSVLSDSGYDYAGTVLPEGKINNISGGTITLLVDGIQTPIKWNELTLGSLAKIASQKLPDVDLKTLNSDIALLAGKPGKSIALNPDDAELRKVVTAAYNAQYDSVKRLISSDLKKAIPKVQLIVKEFSDVPDLEKNILELKALTEKPSTSTTTGPAETAQ